MATLRYRREEETIPDVMKSVAKVGREANRPTGTETALTTQTAGDAKTAADQAAEDAIAAAQAAGEAMIKVDGIYNVIPSETEPTEAPGGGDLKAGDQWWVIGTGANAGKFIGVQVYDGTDWSPRQIVADMVLVPSSVGNVLIADGAIDGKTVTGATIRTAASGARLEMTSRGLVAYDASGNEVAELQGGNGGVTIGKPLSGHYAVLRNEELLLFENGKTYPSAVVSRGTIQLTDGQVNGEYRLQLGRQNGYIERVDRITDPSNVGIDAVQYDVRDGEPRLYVRKQKPGPSGAIAMAMMHVYALPGGELVGEISGDVGSFARVETDVASVDELQPRGDDFTLSVPRDLAAAPGRDVTLSAGRNARISAVKIELDGNVEFPDDSGWVSLRAELGITSPTSWPDESGMPAQIRIRDRTVEIRGVLRNDGAYALSGLGTLPEKYRPPQIVTRNAESALTPTYRKAIRVQPSGLFQVNSSPAGSMQWWLDGISWSLDA